MFKTGTVAAFPKEFLFLQPCMHFISTRLPYRQTHAFSKTVLDYIDQAAALRPFYAYPPSVTGIQQAIEERKKFPVNRDILVTELKKQYAGVEAGDKVRSAIESLLSPDTFTVTTAHQNNLFTGPLFFIYKIIHTIRLAEQLQQSLPKYRFVPVFYIGSEDADLEELNHTWVNGEKLVWDTRQTGAVGRMVIDKALVNLLGRLEGQLTVLSPWPRDHRFAETILYRRDNSAGSHLPVRSSVIRR